MRCFPFYWWTLVGFLVFLDQALKFWVKNNMSVGEDISITSWFFLYFVENNGFAFGYEFFGDYGKFLLTLIRLIFVFFIYRWICDLVSRDIRGPVFYGLLLVFSGAIGNIVDSVFYGVFYGYAPLFFGRVVDMFYFPIFSGVYPDWVPFFGGEPFVFFRYIFNVADSCITVGGGILLFCYKSLDWK